MKLYQAQWAASTGWRPAFEDAVIDPPQLVLLFGSTENMGNAQLIAQVKARFPEAHLFGCSTAGEICQTKVLDETVILTAVHFERTHIATGKVNIDQTSGSLDAGVQLAQSLPEKDLRHVFVLSDGLQVNGSELVKGLTQALPAGVGITGGLSGDGGRFQKTLVVCQGPAVSGAIGILGFYGKHLKIGYGSMGGWDSFGPERLITKSKYNVLYELDGKSALGLYKQYLGEHAKGLPGTGLLFPLSLRVQENQTSVVRTILSVNEDEQSMTFAGDVPEGAYVRLMKANFDRLIDGALGAARNSCESLETDRADLAILISCVGRKMVLKQRIEEEVEGVRSVLGRRPLLTGFYSYGEISPFTPNAKCELHNQTMTITAFTED